MTALQALVSAKLTHGPEATVEIDPPQFYPRMRYVHPSGSWSTFTTGVGRNWEAALNQAEHKYLVRLGVRPA